VSVAEPLVKPVLPVLSLSKGVKRSGIEGLGINFIEGLMLTKYKVQKSHIGGTYYVDLPPKT
jgi:hypothetical protein